MDNSRELRALLSMVFAATSAAVFAASLANEGFYVEQADPHWKGTPGHYLFLYGWMGISVGIFNWLANPVLFASWLMIVNRPSRDFAWLAAFSALCIALSFMLYRKFPNGTTGTHYYISGYGAGYWLWNASIAIMLLGSLTVSLLTHSAHQRPPRRQSKGRTR